MKQRAFSTITRCKREGREYDREYLFEVAANPPENCPCCGRPIDYSLKGETSAMSDRPSFDRINSDKGYVRGNVVVICNRCNTLKGNMGVAELKMLIAYVEKYSA